MIPFSSHLSGGVQDNSTDSVSMSPIAKVAGAPGAEKKINKIISMFYREEKKGISFQFV